MNTGASPVRSPSTVPATGAGKNGLGGSQQESMKTRYHGFTMMELMAVVAVVAILATLALPSYLDRIVRDQIKEALPLADIAKQPIATSWSLTQTFPADNAAAKPQ